jgi:phospholipid/cholesterol/gamma-HCH transport system permease protein
MSIFIRADRERDRISNAERSVRFSPCDGVGGAVEGAEARLSGCVSVDVDLAQLDRVDGAGAYCWQGSSIGSVQAGAMRASLRGPIAKRHGLPAGYLG